MMSGGGLSFPSKKAFSACGEWGGITTAGAVVVRLCVTRTTVVYGVDAGRDWGHTPVWTGQHGKAVFVLTDLVMIVDRMSVAIRGV